MDPTGHELEELDVEGILAFAERFAARAPTCGCRRSLERRQRFQQLFLSEGSRRLKIFGSNRRNRTAFSYLRAD